jgi:hypothetical protein
MIGGDSIGSKNSEFARVGLISIVGGEGTRHPHVTYICAQADVLGWSADYLIR